MKKIILLLVTVICGINLYSQTQSDRDFARKNRLLLYEPTDIYIPRIQKSNVIEDGAYKAIVNYKNYSTSYTAKYTLIVNVINDQVLQINFEDGGFINYKSPNILSYSGGELSFSTDDFGNIDGASTTVTVRDLNGSTMIYKISLII